MDRRQFITALTASTPFLAGCAEVLRNESTEPSAGTQPTSNETQGVSNTDIRFTDIAAKEDSAFTFRRGRNRKAVEHFKQLKEKGTVKLSELNKVNHLTTYHGYGTHGGYGIVIFDYDNDGDLDIFVPNTQGYPNHLYKNKLAETDEFKFEEVAEKAGVASPEKPGYGAAAADLDNDGNRELVVMSPPDEYHQFYDNNGDGTFTDISEQVGITGNGGHICSFGDIDNDGMVDLFIGTSRPDEHVGKPPVPFEGYARNRLFKNQGGLEFEEISEESGIQTLDGIPDDAGGTRTFGVAMVDIDQDGDIEIIHGDDQMIPTAESGVPGEGGVNWGFIHVFDNDGDGHFTDMAKEYNLIPSSVMENMGFAFGDFNDDGQIDFLTTAFGDYWQPALPPYNSIERGDHATKWFIQQNDHSFHTYGVGRLVATPFGWGAAAFDYDNDGYTDMVYHGGADFFSTHVACGTNPGAILHGLGHGMFGFDEAAATSSQRDHCRRMTYAVATGDLNKNGYPDIVTGSNQDVAPDSELKPIDLEYGGPFDEYAKSNHVFEIGEEGETATYTGFDFTEGTLSVEVNDGGTDNNWVAVTPVGGIGIADAAMVNRDGIGATIACTPASMDRTQRFAVTAGASFGSCHSLEKTFGLGQSEQATVEVLWPGGVRNRFYLTAEERLTLPEIPYSFDSDMDKDTYNSHVETSLERYADEGVIPQDHVDRFLNSAMKAYEEEA